MTVALAANAPTLFDIKSAQLPLVALRVKSARLDQVAEELVGPEQVVFPFGPVTGSEDFAYYLQHKPGSFLRLGNGLDSVMLHNAKYDFNDANLSVGAAYWTRLVERFLNEPV